MIEITKRQETVLDCIVIYQGAHGYAPTVRELGDIVGIPTLKGVTGHLDALQKKGYIKRDPLVARAIQVLKKPNGESTLNPGYLAWVTNFGADETGWYATVRFDGTPPFAVGQRVTVSVAKA